ncbi:MAG: hypothetical protein IJU75_05230, partial [Clostridia bacterium]|nr:hypothetical protein [Clostridia bacterium]
LSARQKMLNPALGGRFFYVSKKLMNDLSAHPPESVPALLSALYGRERELVGVRFSKTRVTFTGFGKTPPGREKSPEQLCRLLVRAAERQKWVKPHACRMREPRSALRAWLNSVGATGPEYDGLREALLRSERVENAHSSEE